MLFLGSEVRDEYWQNLTSFGNGRGKENFLETYHELSVSTNIILAKVHIQAISYG